MINWAHPKKGKLIQLLDGSWGFRKGRSSSAPLLPLLDFEKNIFDLVADFRLFPGHMTNTEVQLTRHVSAASLSSMEAPSTLRNLLRDFSPEDRRIWLEAYTEELNALTALDTFDVVTFEDYKYLSIKYGPAIPSNAISTIKLNEANLPVRAKYRIVALGNHEYWNWSKADCYAPVCSLNDVCLITALAFLS